MNKFNVTTIQGKDLIIDISQLLSDEVVYINATKLAKQFGKDRRQLEKFFKTKSFLEYENAIFKVIQKGDFKTSTNSLRFSVKGKYGGTYIHSDLAIVFLRWLNVDFAVKCDMYIKETIQKISNDKLIASATAIANKLNDEWVQARSEATATRNNLTDAIKDFCEYAALNRDKPYKDNKCPYYIKLTSLVYKALDIKKPKGARSARDVYSGGVVEKIEYLEDMLINLILDNIKQDIEYHEAFQSIKELVMYEATLFEEVE